jgi:hypothetical protein
MKKLWMAASLSEQPSRSIAMRQPRSAASQKKAIATIALVATPAMNC